MVARFTESNLDRIKNPNGFLQGIIRRVKLGGPDRADGGKIESLPRAVRRAFDDVFEDVSAPSRRGLC